MGGFGGAGSLGGGKRKYSAEELLDMLYVKLEEELAIHELSNEHAKAYAVRSQLGHLRDIYRKRVLPEPVPAGVRETLAEDDELIAAQKQRKEGVRSEC
jgi:hypothetical protein